jgi:uncharacterized protein YceK
VNKLKYRLLIVLLICYVLVGCSITRSTTSFKDGRKNTKYSMDVMSMKVEKKHASQRSDKGLGFAVKFSAGSNSPFPEVKLGYWGSNQDFTPIVDTEYDKDGKITAQETVPPMIIRVGANPLGKGLEDVMATGQAAINISTTSFDENYQTYPYAEAIAMLEKKVKETQGTERAKWQSTLDMVKEFGEKFGGLAKGGEIK